MIEKIESLKTINCNRNYFASLELEEESESESLELEEEDELDETLEESLSLLDELELGECFLVRFLGGASSFELKRIKSNLNDKNL